MHDVTAGDPHGGLEHGRAAQGTLAHGGLMGRVVPAILGADPPVQAPVGAARLDPASGVGVGDGSGVHRAEGRRGQHGPGPSRRRRADQGVGEIDCGEVMARPRLRRGTHRRNLRRPRDVQRTVTQ